MDVHGWMDGCVALLTTLSKRVTHSTHVRTVFSHSPLFTYLYSQFIILSQSCLIQQIVCNHKEARLFSFSDGRNKLMLITANRAVKPYNY
jgi:hypothetical protein